MKSLLALYVLLIAFKCDRIQSADIIWQSADWTYGCDFKGNDLPNAPTKPLECGPKCLATPGCTHFTWSNMWSNGTCYMKWGSGITQLDAISSNVGNRTLCGIVSNPLESVGGWTYSCDFSGNGLADVQTTSMQCGPKCLSTPGCTHYTWSNKFSNGTCYMKMGNVNQSSAFNSYSGNRTLCGVVLKPLSITPTTPTSLVWSDEFNYNSAPDLSNWIPTVAGNGFGNNELQYYTNNSNVDVSFGYLTIATLKHNFLGRIYTSAKLTSTKSFTYGVFEMRAKLPKGRGTWPAFWLLSAKKPFAWPLNGEIDIMEAVGYESNPSSVYGTIHCKDKVNSGHLNLTDPYTSFHTYKADWNSKRIKFYVDDQLYHVYYNDLTGNYKTWPFDGPFNIIINNAIGGNWGGIKGVDDSIFPTYYTIDFVRVYAPNGDP